MRIVYSVAMPKGREVEQFQHEIPPGRKEEQIGPAERVDREAGSTLQAQQVQQFEIETAWAGDQRIEVEFAGLVEE